MFILPYITFHFLNPSDDGEGSELLKYAQRLLRDDRRPTWTWHYNSPVTDN